MENNISDKIDLYLDNKMSLEDKASFEKEISSNEELRKQVETQRNLRQGIDRLNLKSNISSQFRKMTLKSKIYKWGIATVAVVAVASLSYFGYNLAKNISSNTYTLPTLNEQGKAEWSDADKNLPTQLFSIDPTKDTVLETEGGIVFAIPAGAFLNAKNPVSLEVREALSAMDIMKAGLSTTSDGKLLETGGMFYLNARNGEQSLKINPDKPVYANIPTNEIKPGMMVFDGERKPDGSINWKNPKKMEKQLIPVDIFSLDFYPKGFRAKVAELGFDANNKRVTDSIYYSYAGRKDFLINNFQKDSSRASSGEGSTSNGINLDSMIKVMEMEESNYKSPDGEALFNLNCRPCHTISNQKSTGPGLKGVLDRAPSRDWLHAFIENSQKMISSGDPYANKIYKNYAKANMTIFGDQLSSADIDAILGYASSGGYDPSCLEINPARISAIWDDKFQNTLIATKEFEERLQVIFKIGNPAILELYINNLDKKMYEIDSMAEVRSGGMQEFHEFYLRHDGGVSITNSHMKKLQDYFNKKRKAVQDASEKTFADRKSKEQKEDKKYSTTKSQQSIDDTNRIVDNFTKELKINMTEAYRQLGIPHNTTPPPNGYYSVPMTSSGWCNVDRFVNESTTNRTTLDYTDPNSGKKAVIKYEAITINVLDSKNYDQLTVYLVPDSLNSFMKVNGSDGKYSEKLNELFHYSLVIMGQKNGKWFWAKRNNVKPENIELQLEAIEETQLKAELEFSNPSNVSNDFKKEIEVMKEEHNYQMQLQARKKQEEIDAEIMPVIFPFYAQGIPGAKPASPFGGGQ